MGCDSEVVRGASTCDAPVRSASNAATQRETQRDDPPLLALGHLQRGAANSQKGVPAIPREILQYPRDYPSTMEGGRGRSGG